MTKRDEGGGGGGGRSTTLPLRTLPPLSPVSHFVVSPRLIADTEYCLSPSFARFCVSLRRLGH